jgi:hypothetical protein
MQRDEFPAKEFFSETQKTESIEIAGAVRPRLCMRLTKRLLQLSLIYSYLSSHHSEPTRNGEHGSHRTP